MRSLAALVLALVFPVAVLAAPNMREGLWEITTQTEIRGGPAMPNMGPQTISQCFTRQDVENPRSMIPAQSGCSIEDVESVGERVQWKLQCTAPIPAEGTGETLYNGTSFTGTATMRTDLAGMKLEVATRYNGRRTGDCRPSTNP